MTSWWTEFFDDDYPFLYGAALTPERTEREVAGAVAILGLREGQRLLDLCCGDGRHAVALQRRGLRVTGVDASRPLLRRAARKARAVLGGARADDGDSDGEAAAHEPGQQRSTAALPLLVQADARALPLRCAFDAAVILFSSIGYVGTPERLDQGGDRPRSPNV